MYACLAVTLLALGIVTTPAIGSEDKYIKGKDAFERLAKMEGERVRIVFKSLEGKEFVCFVKVGKVFVRDRFTRLPFTYRYWTLPESDRPLVQDYLEEKLGRKLENTPKDKRLLTETDIRPLGLELTGSDAVLPYPISLPLSPCLILSIEPLVFKAPLVQLDTEIKGIELNDGFASDKKGEPARWGVSYGLPKDDKRFVYRPKNGITPVTGIEVSLPRWHLDDKKWSRVVEVTIRYRNKTGSTSLLTLNKEGHVDGSLHGQIVPSRDYLLHLYKKLAEERSRRQ